jgi:tetratricopeptide (TPR) repeat protein
MRSIATRGSYSEDDALYDVAQAYLSGAVLSFHFYNTLSGLEKVGISFEDVFDEMVATTNFEREAGRPKEFEPLMGRVAAGRAKPAKNAGRDDVTMGSLASKMLASDDLIRQRKFAEARAILSDVLTLQPNNARALYGMAQITTQTASPVELNPSADENDKIQAQHDRLEQAIKLYRKAIENASKDSERWVIQWSHVLLGRIFDFQEFRADAIGEYEKAIALGPDIPNGAYKEAVEGKQRPFGQK